MLWEQMYGFLRSFFVYDNTTWQQILVAVGLALAFGAVWLLAHWIPLKRKPALLLVMLASGFLTLLAITFIQYPLQYYSSMALSHFWDNGTLADWWLLTGIPTVLVTGIVQEAAKMVPMVFWWWRSGWKLTPRMGLAIGAAAGAGYGIFEAVWGIGNTFGAGWVTDFIGQYGFLGITPFWERFFILGVHIGLSALVGYGLAIGKGWLYYLIAAFLHAFVNWATVFYQYFVYVKGSEFLTVTRLEIILAVLSILITAWAVYFRWFKTRNQPLEPEEAMPVMIDTEVPAQPLDQPPASDQPPAGEQ
jgi:hypothetical protein